MGLGRQTAGVLIATPESAVRRALVGAVESLDGFHVSAEAADGRGAQIAAAAHPPAVVLISAQVPGGVVGTIAEILSHAPTSSIVVLTASAGEMELFAALKAGATGYLPMSLDPARLPDVLRGVLAGEAALPRALVARLIEEYQGRGERRVVAPGGRVAVLTEREREVLDRLRAGASTSAIAEELFVSPVTVRRHISTALAKLRVADREAAITLLDAIDQDAAES